ncbi:hypothetical protein L0B53_18830 (plasmid) [Vibrio sp. SS-MA-C1-2]|nr:hypothetical protein L0B53_18830 [Vibrio sp. SS-MA-C1-2]
MTKHIDSTLIPTKFITVTLTDEMRIEFKSNEIISSNDVVKFVITNIGKINHEFTIGTEQEQLSHREMMKQMPHHMHDSEKAVTLKPGQTKVLVWSFVGSGDIEFACNIPGHSESGMFKKITY